MSLKRAMKSAMRTFEGGEEGDWLRLQTGGWSGLADNRRPRL